MVTLSKKDHPVIKAGQEPKPETEKKLQSRLHLQETNNCWLSPKQHNLPFSFLSKGFQRERDPSSLSVLSIPETGTPNLIILPVVPSLNQYFSLYEYGNDYLTNSTRCFAKTEQYKPAKQESGKISSELIECNRAFSRLLHTLSYTGKKPDGLRYK